MLLNSISEQVQNHYNNSTMCLCTESECYEKQQDKKYLHAESPGMSFCFEADCRVLLLKFLLYNLSSFKETNRNKKDLPHTLRQIPACKTK